jgi:muconate cycloisomerase
MARRCKAAGFRHVKIKVASGEDAERVAAVRSILGPSASIRLDANGAFKPADALRFLESVAGCGIDCIEQPIPRGSAAELAALRAASPVPVMADESIVTVQDAEELIAASAVDSFNLRISKCGGIGGTLAISAQAASAGVGVQLGCHVGETAVLSAAGRCLAAFLADLRFVEGSYGTHLLKEDIANEDIAFGPGGEAPLLAGAGLGINVRDDLLDKHAALRIPVGEE